MFQPEKKKSRNVENDVDQLFVVKSTPQQNIKKKTPNETIVHDRHLQSIRNNGFWCKVLVKQPNVTDDGYNLGKIVLRLKLNREHNGSEKFASDFNNVNIAQRFPGFDSIRIQVDEMSSDGKNVIDFQTRTEISKDDSSLIMGLPKGKRPLQPDHKHIEMKHFIFAFDKLSVPAALFGKPGKLGPKKIFKIEFEKYDSIYKEIILQVKINPSAIKGDPSYVEETAPNMMDAIPVFDYYFIHRREESQMSNSAPEYRPNEDAQRFYSLMKDYHIYENRPNPPDTVQDPRMMAQLMDYQKESVAWMLTREGALELNDEDNHSTEELQRMLSLNINKRVNLKLFGNKCNRDIYYSKTSGCLSWEKQPIEKLPSTGGILADEMGLGKTIELLSLILLNPRPSEADVKHDTQIVNDDVKISSFECTCGILDPKNEDIVTCVACGNSQHARCMGFEGTIEVQLASNYQCPHCTVKLTPKPVKSTLIVVPNSLLKQWEEEIENNITDESLKVRVYSGFHNGKKYVHPAVLADYDIVLTTYEILRQEIHYTDLPEQTRLRDHKRYAAMSCPLVQIQWWRVCLDEAQMVENVNWSISKMAQMLPAVNRWCVSGTPIPKSLQDLYGLVCFLDIDPITDIDLWNSLIMEPFKLNNSQFAITMNLFGKIFWRTEKEYVQDQLRLPRQTEVIHRLEFSPTERYFYDQRAQYWSDKFKEAVDDVDPDQNISTLNLSQLLPFRRLRAICTHPQLDDEAFKAVDIFLERDAKLSFNVFELNDWLIKQALTRLQKAYKMQMIALNDLAGLQMIKHQYENAARQYKCAINLAEENQNLLRTDDVNLLHALVNINNVHEKLNVRHFDATVRADELIGNLIRPRTNELTVTKTAIAHNHQTVNFVFDEDAWWIRAIDYTKCHENATELLRNLYAELKKEIPVEQMTLKQSDVQPLTAFITNLQHTMKKNLLEICTKRDEIFANWREISSTDSIPSYLHLTLLQCNHFSDPIPDGGLVNQPSSCQLCSFQCELQKYQSLLCRSPRKTDFALEEVWMKSWTETMLHVIHRFAQKNKFPATILTDAKRHIGQFCDLQNEIRLFWTWSTQMNDRTYAIQSLLDEAKPKDEPSQRTSISNQMAVMAVDQSNQKFKECLRDLMYLQGLKAYGYQIPDSPSAGTDPQRCHVDHVQQKLIFLPCNHFFCANCHPDKDKDEYRCFICHRTSTKRMSVDVDMQSASKHSVTNIPSLLITNETIWRNPFIKVEAVVRTLLTIKISHPGDKALVICSSEAMLQVFAAEFLQNDISYILYRPEKLTSKRQSWIRFRTDDTQVLLMPLAVASTGLNLTEANHVFLVEPYMNLATEEQAIGRIHRLGQRKETFVHKYYVAGTIEEKLVRMDDNKKTSSFVDGNMTVRDLLDLMSLQSSSPLQNFSGNSLSSSMRF